jgi:hypothetical protein
MKLAVCNRQLAKYKRAINIAIIANCFLPFANLSFWEMISLTCHQALYALWLYYCLSIVFIPKIFPSVIVNQKFWC